MAEVAIDTDLPAGGSCLAAASVARCRARRASRSHRASCTSRFWSGMRAAQVRHVDTAVAGAGEVVGGAGGRGVDATEVAALGGPLRSVRISLSWPLCPSCLACLSCLVGPWPVSSGSSDCAAAAAFVSPSTYPQFRPQAVRVRAPRIRKSNHRIHTS